MRALRAAVVLIFTCQKPELPVSQDASVSAAAADAGLLRISAPPLSFCSLGLAILHSRSPRFGKHFERLSKGERLPRLAVFAGIDDAGWQPCVDEMFSIVGEHDAPRRWMGPKISLWSIDGGYSWGAMTFNLHPLGLDGRPLNLMEFSGGMRGLAFVVDGGWVICNDCPLPPGFSYGDGE